MNSELITRVTVFAVGVENYEHLRPLRGPGTDVEKIHELLVSSSTTAIFSESQFIKILDPTSEELRSRINSYTLGRSASGDILLFYFSGHGVSIGRDDFGFCTTDTVSHPGVDTALPFTVVKFSDLLATISIMGIIPIVIIDACYSGSAGSALISPHEAISTMHNEIEKTNASNHALLCSCSDLQSSLDSPTGGLFSRCMFEVINTGIPNLRTGPYMIGLKDIYQPLTNLTMSH
jgi:hypothetical protein